MYSEQQRAKDAVRLVGAMSNEQKDNMLKQLVGEQRFNSFKLSTKYEEIRDKTIISQLFQFTYGNEKLNEEQLVNEFKEIIRKRDLNIKYRGYAIKGLDKFARIRDYILAATGEETLNPAKMIFQGNNGEGGRMYLYGGRFLIIYENSPLQIGVQDMLTGDLIYNLQEA